MKEGRRVLQKGEHGDPEQTSRLYLTEHASPVAIEHAAFFYDAAKGSRHAGHASLILEGGHVRINGSFGHCGLAAEQPHPPRPATSQPVNNACFRFFFVLYLITLFLLSNDKGIAFFGFRSFAEPIIVYFIARSITVPLDLFLRYLKWMVVLGTLISLWAIFQAGVLGEDFLVKMGYDVLGVPNTDPSRPLSNAFYLSLTRTIRAIGTFNSPNNFGNYLEIVIVFTVFLISSGLLKRRFWGGLSLAVLFSGLLYSFSRSAWIALFLAMAFFSMLTATFCRNIKRFMAFASIMVLVFIAGRQFIPGTIIPLTAAHVSHSITLEDPSARTHVLSLKEGVERLLSEPLGTGLGTSGPRSRQKGFFHSENSFIILGFDAGVLGLLIYLVFLSSIAYDLLRKILFVREDLIKTIAVSGFCIFVGQIFVWMVLPGIVELENSLVFFSLLAVIQSISDNVLKEGTEAC